MVKGTRCILGAKILLFPKVQGAKKEKKKSLPKCSKAQDICVYPFIFQG